MLAEKSRKGEKAYFCQINVNATKPERRELMLTKERKGEIALLVLKHQKKKEGIRLCPETFKRDVGNMAKSIGISSREAMEFAKEIVEETVRECFD